MTTPKSKSQKKNILTVEDTQKIAKLARLNISPEEEEKFTEQMNNILGYFEKLSELDTEGVIPRTHPTDVVNNFREDIVIPSLTQEEALQNAPNKKNGYFKAPKIV